MKSSTKLPKRTLRDHFSFKMTANNAAHWKLTREKGKKRFVLLIGVFGWGCFMAIFTIIRELMRGEELGLSLVILNFLLWPLMGVLFGWAVWSASDKQYQSYINKNQV